MLRNSIRSKKPKFFLGRTLYFDIFQKIKRISPSGIFCDVCILVEKCHFRNYCTISLIKISFSPQGIPRSAQSKAIVNRHFILTHLQKLTVINLFLITVYLLTKLYYVIKIMTSKEALKILRI